MNKFKIYKVLENNISISNVDGNIINNLDYSKSILSSIPVKNGNLYVCVDTLNLYVDTNLGRIPLDYTFINTENDRLSLEYVNNGYYYIGETNVLWIYNGSWKVYADNKDNNYPGQSINNNSYSIFSDSFKMLVNKKENKLGSLLINPEVSVIVESEDSFEINENGEKVASPKIIERIMKSNEFGKMIFYGDYYTNKDGKIRRVTDDGCIDDMSNFSNQPQE